MIYVVSRGTYVSGGPETLHQAASIFKSFGEKVAMYYVQPHTMVIPERFSEYQLEVTDHIEDDENNILIVPETQTFILKRFKRIRKCIWWLSVDFFETTAPVKLTKMRMEANHWPSFMFPFAFLVLIAKGKIHTYRYHFEDHGSVFHLYNCEYAHQYLLKQGIHEERTQYLCGPLNKTFFKKAEKLSGGARKNIVLYNPKKGVLFTQKIIEAAKREGLNIEFVPLINMSPNQIAEMMSIAKVYMDFGNFPGPERIPREAVTMGCNIITSTNGSAANTEDIPIPECLKYHESEQNIMDIISKLNDMLMNYEKYYPLYERYRMKVREQQALLSINAKLFLEKM